MHRADAVVVDDAVGVSAWPQLTLSTWEGTRDTLHLWTQIVGKVRLALAPMVNHWWQVPLYVSARGLTTSIMPTGRRGLEIQFDFTQHRLDLLTTDGQARSVPLQPGSIADFYAATMAALGELAVEIQMFPVPVELVEAVPFNEDTAERPYDPDAARRFWLALVQANRVMQVFRARYQGKVSPVHFFWGAADLAVTRFSGRLAPTHSGGIPNCPDWVMQLAYSHEVSSCGFWPGGSEEGSFYSYAYPAPKGFSDWAVQPSSAYFDHQLGEYVLPYAAVRTAEDPDATLLAFFQSTYEAAATLAAWDRAALEIDGHSNDLHIRGPRKRE
jgi:Family of unknown function (DUF5996)